MPLLRSLVGCTVAAARAGKFPKSVCTSVNECICHGIPDSRPLREGDILNIDVTVFLNVRLPALLCCLAGWLRTCSSTILDTESRLQPGAGCCQQCLVCDSVCVTPWGSAMGC